MEEVLLIIIADDRVARQLGEITAAMKDEVRYLEGLPASLWSRIAEALGGSYASQGLRNATLHAAHTSCGEFSRRSVWQFDRDPWPICHGNVQGNFDGLLLRDERPEDPTANGILTPLRAGPSDLSQTT